MFGKIPLAPEIKGRQNSRHNECVENAREFHIEMPELVELLDQLLFGNVVLLALLGQHAMDQSGLVDPDDRSHVIDRAVDRINKEHQRKTKQVQPQRVHITGTLTSQVFLSKESRFGEQRAHGAEDLGVKMRKFMQRLMREMPEGKMAALKFLLPARRAEFLDDRFAACRT